MGACGAVVLLPAASLRLLPSDTGPELSDVDESSVAKVRSHGFAAPASRFRQGRVVKARPGICGGSGLVLTRIQVTKLELGIIVLAVTICSCEVGCLSSAPTKVRVAHPSPH